MPPNPKPRPPRRVNIIFRATEFAMLAELATLEGLSRSDIVRQLVRQAHGARSLRKASGAAR